MKMWKVQYEEITETAVIVGTVKANVKQLVKDDENHFELREFFAWAPVLIVEG